MNPTLELAAATLRQARVIAAALIAGPIALLGLAVAIPVSLAVETLTLPAGLAGLVAPVAAYRLYATSRERVAAATPPAERCAAFVRATLLALGISEAAALAGLVVFWGSRHPAALTGIAMHLLVSGAVWPSRARLEVFLAGGTAGEGGRR